MYSYKIIVIQFFKLVFQKTISFELCHRSKQTILILNKKCNHLKFQVHLNYDRKTVIIRGLDQKKAYMMVSKKADANPSHGKQKDICISTIAAR